MTKKQPLVIGYDGSRAFVSSRTGTENYSFSLLKNILEVDKKNYYIVYLRPNVGEILEKSGLLKTAITGTNPRNFSEDGRVKYHSINYYRLWTQIGLSAQTFTDKLDLLFVPAHTLPIIRRPNLPTVVTVHDLGSEFLPKTHQLKQRLYLSLMQRLQLKGATKIIAVSKATKTDLISKVGIDNGKISVIYEGYDQQLFRPIKGDLLNNSLKQFDLKAGDYFLFVGTVQPRKNLERLIRAYAQYLGSRGTKRNLTRNQAEAVSVVPRIVQRSSALDLVIAGSNGWLADDIYQLPRELGIEKKVRFLGRVEDQDLPALYSGARALTFPSLFEGFGLPIIEAQACGCPVITSKTSSMPEVAGQGAILVDAFDIESISKGMLGVQSPESRVQLVKLGFENIKRFSWVKCARETIRVFESVSNG